MKHPSWLSIPMLNPTRSSSLPQWFGLPLLLILFLTGCTGQAAGEPTPTAVPTPVVAQKPTYTVQRGTVTRTLHLTGQAAPVQQQNLFFRADGYVREVYVSRGDMVEADDVLARLDEPEKYTSDIANAQIALEKAQHELDQLYLNAPLEAAQAQLDLAEATVSMEDAQRNRTKMDYGRDYNELVVEKAHTDFLLAKGVLKEARKAYNRVAHKKLTDPERVMALRALVDAQNVYDRSFAIWNWYLLPWPEDTVAKADADLALALAQYDQAEAQWELLEQGPDPYKLKLAQANLEDAQAGLAQAHKTLENIELRAPFAGEVLSLGIHPGSQVTAFKGVLTLADPDELEIVLFPSADDLAALGIGQAATVVIQLEQHQDVLWLPPGALRTFQGRNFVFVEEGGVQRRVDVQLGLRSAERVEILEGLREGQVVIGQ